MQGIKIVIGIMPPTWQEPMLAPHVQAVPELIDFPALVSRKLDGIRCLIFPGQGAITRSAGMFPNEALPLRLSLVQQIADRAGMVFDGELYEHGRDYYSLQSAIMSYDGDLAGIGFHAFDCVPYGEFEGDSLTPYTTRIETARRLLGPGRTLKQHKVNTWAGVAALFRRFTAAGYEGAIIRQPKGLYRHGRCRVSEREIFKLKQTETFDAEIITLRGKGVRVRMGNGAELNLALSAENRRLAEIGSWVEFTGTNYGARRRPRFGRFHRWRPDLKESRTGSLSADTAL